MSSQRPPTPYPAFQRKSCESQSTKEVLAQYCKEMLEKSMLTGVPQIVSAPTTRSKVFKTFVLLGSVTGFLYQTSTFLVMYFSYPTLVDVQVTTPPFVDVPAITLCNRNGLRRQEYCRLYPENCEPVQNIGKFCEHYAGACENGRLIGGNMFPKAEFTAEEETVTQDMIEEAGHPPYPLVSSCEFKQVNVSFDLCKNDSMQSYVFKDLYGKMKKCYILNARWNKQVLNLPLVPTRAVLKLTIDLEPEQYFRIDRKVSAQIALHSPWDIVNPFLDGYTVKPKRTYIIRLKEDIKNLLPWPYQTNCTDYIGKWKIRGKNGPLSKEMCIEECILNQTMDDCKCVRTDNLYPHNFKFCGANTEECTQKVNFTECYVKCSPACHSRSFSFSVQEEEALLGLEEKSAKAHNWNRTIVLLLMFSRTQVNIYRYRAKYETIEFFSFMGGFVGIWLGVSLIALLDFLESLATFTVFLFDRFKASNKITEIRSAVTRMRSNSTFSSDSMPWNKPQQNGNNLMVRPARRMPVN